MIECVPVKTLELAQAMRVIRNECAKDLTRNRNQISVEEQIGWFARFDRNIIRPFLYVLDRKTPIGYGTVVYDDARHATGTIGAGVAVAHRGKGYSYPIIGSLFFNAFSDPRCTLLWGEAFAYNEKILKADFAHGFEVVGRFKDSEGTELLRVEATRLRWRMLGHGASNPVPFVDVEEVDLVR